MAQEVYFKQVVAKGYGLDVHCCCHQSNERTKLIKVFNPHNIL